ncbi:BAG family molecular chaperone regulator [Aspergillus clavatus NRRL 1]|uniref:BAG domain protein n=1 Tax=Aspergillus clavatus (strain ATCC 1007 / CBS 513.65 / DSM 816 / NCTC 3887 / NRRL 1 / QM 1276 / 107) TaxID=344612 RepID=A1CR56_ASPCL|nr:BAG domain protein [Aspergillus clavatus NRRL 1]EAW08127.1 BAG domain protein [Aspergillus clavatus NRRL 1]
MTLLPLHIAQSSLGQRCASYLTTVSDTLHQRLVSPLLSARASSSSSSSSFPPSSLSSSFSSLRSLTLPFDWAILDSADPSATVTAVLAVLACIFVLVTMSWRFGDFFRRGPYAKVPPPHISDSDYTYLTPEDIVDPPAARPFAPQHFPSARDDEAPDTILLKHRQKTYALNFPAYAINDGALSVGDLRRRAAEATGTSNPARVKLLYKGKLLDDDAKSCRAEGLKQQSEVLCVVSEVQPGERTPSEVSDAEGERAGDHAGRADEAPAGEKKKRNRNRHKNKKKNKNRKSLEEDGAPGTPGAPGAGAGYPPAASLAPPADQRKPTSSSSSLPPSAPNLKTFPTAFDQANALLSYFRTVLLPLCNAYIAHPPTEAKARDFEHKKLSETILAQVILKADGIEPDGDEAARNARRALIKEAQTALNRLDQAAHA